jgi:hypothetical protein
MSDGLTYTCRSCDRSLPWTDGQSLVAGDPVNEYWCQFCGEEQPLPQPDPIDWPARFRAGAKVAHRRGRIVLGEELHYAAQGDPDVVEAIGRALLEDPS